MSISPELIEQLLYENESSTLDFKRDQYEFDGATDEDKAELLKDILAFANSWGRSNAYILIGVDEVPSGRSIVVGVSEHLDDAKVQQFVNSKTQRPLHFSYHALTCEGKGIGVICIPPQERPLYLKRGFGKLKKDTVYVRRGTSTDIASPDEISKMRQSSSGALVGLPILDVQFFDAEAVSGIGTAVLLETLSIEVPQQYDIPDFRGSRDNLPGLLSKFEVVDPFSNKAYYRQYAEYIRERAAYGRTDFSVTNSGHSVAQDVRLRCEVKEHCDIVFFADASSMPTPPSPNSIGVKMSVPVLNPDIAAQKAPDRWIIEASLGKVQPQGTSHTVDGLYVGAKQEHELTLTMTVSADNLSVPRTQEMMLKIRPRQKRIDVNELLRFIHGDTD